MKELSWTMCYFKYLKLQVPSLNSVVLRFSCEFLGDSTKSLDLSRHFKSFLQFFLLQYAREKPLGLFEISLFLKAGSNKCWIELTRVWTCALACATSVEFYVEFIPCLKGSWCQLSHTLISSRQPNFSLYPAIKVEIREDVGNFLGYVMSIVWINWSQVKWRTSNTPTGMHWVTSSLQCKPGNKRHRDSRRQRIC